MTSKAMEIHKSQKRWGGVKSFKYKRRVLFASVMHAHLSRPVEYITPRKILKINCDFLSQ